MKKQSQVRMMPAMTKEDPFGLRAAAWRVAEEAEHAWVDSKRVAELVDSREPQAAEWDRSLHFYDGTEKTANWLLALDAVNFSFWPDPGEAPWRVVHSERRLGGYAGLALAFQRAVDEGFPLWDAAFLASLSPDTLHHILRGEGTIPLFEARLANLREAGRVLVERCDGSLAALLTLAEGSAAELVRLVADHFPSFRDISVHRGIRLFFYKRAQLLASDLAGAFGGVSYGRFHDLHVLTAFADYKLPQVLRSFGVLRYSRELETRVRERLPVPAQSPMEIEIRAVTIRAVEEISDALREKKGKECPPCQVDAWLWGVGQSLPGSRFPYHLTRTIFY